MYKHKHKFRKLWTIMKIRRHHIIQADYVVDLAVSWHIIKLFFEPEWTRTFIMYLVIFLWYANVNMNILITFGGMRIMADHIEGSIYSYLYMCIYITRRSKQVILYNKWFALTKEVHIGTRTESRLIDVVITPPFFWSHLTPSFVAKVRSPSQANLFGQIKSLII